MRSPPSLSVSVSSVVIPCASLSLQAEEDAQGGEVCSFVTRDSILGTDPAGRWAGILTERHWGSGSDIYMADVSGQ